MERRRRPEASISPALKPNERAIRAILAVRSGLFTQASEACEHSKCTTNLYCYHIKGPAGTMPLDSFDLLAIKVSVKAAAPAAAAAAAATPRRSATWMGSSRGIQWTFCTPSSRGSQSRARAT